MVDEWLRSVVAYERILFHCLGEVRVSGRLIFAQSQGERAILVKGPSDDGCEEVGSDYVSQICRFVEMCMMRGCLPTPSSAALHARWRVGSR